MDIPGQESEASDINSQIELQTELQTEPPEFNLYECYKYRVEACIWVSVVACLILQLILLMIALMYNDQSRSVNVYIVDTIVCASLLGVLLLATITFGVVCDLKSVAKRNDAQQNVGSFGVRTSPAPSSNEKWCEIAIKGLIVSYFLVDLIKIIFILYEAYLIKFGTYNYLITCNLLSIFMIFPMIAGFQSYENM